MTDRLRQAFLLVLLVLVVVCPTFAQEDGSGLIAPVEVERQILKAFTDGDHGKAASLIEQYLKTSPDDPTMWYNLACARSLLNEGDPATEALMKALQAGFRDFDHMKSDPDLANIRSHPKYTAIVEATERVNRRGRFRGRSALERWKRQYGEDEYKYEIDEELNLAYATALDEIAHREMREMLEEEAHHLIQTLFEAATPYQVLIALPTPAHADGLFQGDDSIGGIYEHGRRRLISRDIGGSLRHEFVHVLHYGHMHRLRQEHPIWIQEGLATLYEDYDMNEAGTIHFLPNERQRIIQNLVRANRLTKWDTIFDMTTEQFMSRGQVGRMYPQVRSIFEFLAVRGKLVEWYQTYVETYDEDRSGRLAMERVFGIPVEDVEQEWRDWLRNRPYVDTTIEYGDAALGIEGAMRGSNDGVTVTRVIPGSAAGTGGIRVRDVIVSIDGKATRTLGELQRIVAQHRVGDEVSLRVRRGETYRTVTVALRALER